MPELLAYPRVLFDFGAVGSIGGELAALGVRRPLLLTDRGLVEHGVARRVLDALPGDIEATVFAGILPNPTVAGVEAAAETYLEQGLRRRARGRRRLGDGFGQGGARRRHP